MTWVLTRVLRWYHGDFTIIMDNCIDIRIPIDQVVVDEPTLEHSGQLITSLSI
jgi:hypothetical protein